MSNKKPMNRKAYGSIPHLPGSRRGPADKGLEPQQSALLTDKVRDRYDTIIVQEKLDGSCVGAYNCPDTGEILALGRAGYLASSSPYPHINLFANWVDKWRHEFYKLLPSGYCVVGEWLAQATGTMYDLKDNGHKPFFPFDIFDKNHNRLKYMEFLGLVSNSILPLPHLLSYGPPCSIDEALARLGRRGFAGATEEAEGCVWRLERKGRVEFMGKYVKPGKVDGKYFPEQTGGEIIWNKGFDPARHA